jgi:hypothetical protein
MKKLFINLFFIFLSVTYGQIKISTAQYDNTRNSTNTKETVLTPTTVVNLNRLGSYILDGAILAPPLYVPSVVISSVSYNLLIATTLNNTVYALNADKPGSAPLWSTNFGSTWGVPIALYYGASIGIVSAPAVDITNGFIYLVSVNSGALFTLRKVSLTTGVQAISIDISGSYPGVGGSGDQISGSNVLFHGPWEINHTPLTLANGNVYFGFSAGNEPFSWHGWIFSYDTATLTQQAVLLLTSSGYGAGASWVGAGFVVDSSGNLYLPTGNGDWNGTTNFSQSIVKVNPSLVITDWFTPSNWSATDGVDADLASGILMMIPGTTLLTIGSKDGRVWVVDSTNMGHLQGTGNAPQVFTAFSLTAGGGTGIYGGIFLNSNGYFPNAGSQLSGFSFSGSTFTTTAFASTVSSFAQVAAAGSSNNGTNSILWLLTVASQPAVTARPVTLRAMNPATLIEYWNSGAAIGSMSKFAAPLIANGCVYVSTFDSGIQVFGLLPSAGLKGATSIIGTIN